MFILIFFDKYKSFRATVALNKNQYKKKPDSKHGYQGLTSLCVSTHQFVHEIWVRAGGEQLSAGQSLVSNRVVLKGIPKGRLHPTDAGLQQTRGGGNT